MSTLATRRHSVVALFRTLLADAQGPEHVVVAACGFVIGNVGQQVRAHGSAREDVDAAADALPVVAANASGPAVSTVADDAATKEGERRGRAVRGIRGAIPDAAALTTAAVAA